MRKARKSDNGEHIRHDAVSGRQYYQQLPRKRRTHSTEAGNIHWQYPFRRPSPTGSDSLSKLAPGPESDFVLSGHQIISATFRQMSTTTVTLSREILCCIVCYVVL